MVRFAVIGTNFITDWMIEGARLCEGFALKAVYSRTLDRAKKYAAQHGAELAFDDLDELAVCDEVDAVYIASPNYTHKDYAIKMLNAGKHVLVEKPAATSAKEYSAMMAAASQNNVIVMEAMKSVFMPEFIAIKEHLPKLGPVRRATFSYCQYSSRYDKFKNGVIENAFKPELGNGSLMDIGVYCISTLAEVFGKPNNVIAQCVKLANGVDGAGTVLLQYDGMLAEALYSKITNSFITSEIQGENGCMLITSVNTPTKIEIVYNDKERELVKIPQSDHNMQYEIREFIRLVEESGDPAPYNQRSMTALEIMDDARRQMGIVFPNDRA